MKRTVKATRLVRRPVSLADSNAFERAMREMAADPEVRAECRAIARDFADAEGDGLPDD